MRHCMGALIGLAIFGLLVGCPGQSDLPRSGNDNQNANLNGNSNTNDNADGGNTDDNSSNGNANANANENDNSSNGNDNTNGPATFVDTEMVSWTIFDTLEDGNVTQNDANQAADDGNPAPSRRMSVAVDEGSSAIIIHVQTDY